MTIGVALISIITPLLNEEDYVEPFLDRLRVLEGCFELILVDGGSLDGTLVEVDRNREGFGHEIRLLKADRGRAVQMNRGADEAKGDVLLFLHVDCQISKDSLKLIEREMLQRKIIGGGFRQAFSSSDLFLTVVSALGNLRARLTKTFFGDFGIFLRNDIFKKVGGYDNMSFLEDVELCRKAKRYGDLHQIDRWIRTSPRRFLVEGKIRLTVIFALACFLNFFRLRPNSLKKYFAPKGR